MATPGVFEINIFWNKGYGFLISVHDITNKILLRDSNYIVSVFMWQWFGNSSEKSYHKLNFISIWPESLLFLGCGLG